MLRMSSFNSMTISQKYPLKLLFIFSTNPTKLYLFHVGDINYLKVLLPLIFKPTVMKAFFCYYIFPN